MNEGERLKGNLGRFYCKKLDFLFDGYGAYSVSRVGRYVLSCRLIEFKF